MIRTLDIRTLGLEAVVQALDRPPAEMPAHIHATVEEVVGAVRERGDDAVVEFTRRFDGYDPPAATALVISGEEFAAAERSLAPDVRAALVYAAERIRRYHEAARPSSWRITDAHGSVLGQEVRPLDRVGIYIPGGRAAYPSTVLMTAIPAQVAGVREIALVTPPTSAGAIVPAVLAAARLAGVTEGYRIGGAQAVAALAYGTKTIRRVDKIVGPGNVYVALAKRRVFGDVGIDMVAGPSEILVIADATAQPAWIAADLLAQAEHDPLARAVLVTDDDRILEETRAALVDQLRELPRREIAARALADHGALVRAGDLAEALDLANRLAPEHLELFVREPGDLLSRVRRAGAVFLGGHTPEVVGDYVAGPSHVLPTGGTARFASPLGTEDFVTRSSVIAYSEGGLRDALIHLDLLAGVERLEGHAAAAWRRLPGAHRGELTGGDGNGGDRR